MSGVIITSRLISYSDMEVLSRDIISEILKFEHRLLSYPIRDVCIDKYHVYVMRSLIIYRELTMYIFKYISDIIAGTSDALYLHIVNQKQMRRNILHIYLEQ